MQDKNNSNKKTKIFNLFKTSFKESQQRKENKSFTSNEKQLPSQLNNFILRKENTYATYHKKNLNLQFLNINKNSSFQIKNLKHNRDLKLTIKDMKTMKINRGNNPFIKVNDSSTNISSLNNIDEKKVNSTKNENLKEKRFNFLLDLSENINSLKKNNSDKLITINKFEEILNFNNNKDNNIRNVKNFAQKNIESRIQSINKEIFNMESYIKVFSDSINEIKNYLTKY